MRLSDYPIHDDGRDLTGGGRRRPLEPVGHAASVHRDDAATRQAKLAVDSRAFPLFTFDPRRGESVAERLSLQGNPALKADWSEKPDHTPVDFLAFARSEGRFAPHFAADGTASPEVLATQQDRLANWRTLKELAGLS